MHFLLKQEVGQMFCTLVLALAGFLFILNLGAKPLWDYDEAIFANIIHDTQTSNDPLTLHWRGTPMFEKPPLSFWLGMEADSVFHDPEFSYRLTAAVAGVLSVLLVMLITFEMSESLLTAAFAGFILLTTGPFLEAGRQLKLDVPAISMFLLSVYCFIKGQRSPKWLMGIGVALAIGFFFKSVIGLLSLPFILFWSLSYWDFRWLKSIYTWIGGLLLLVIFLPWHIYESLKYGSVFWQSYIGSAVLQRFSSDVIGGSASAGDYIGFFFTFAAPWTIVFAAVVWWLLVQGKQLKTPELKPIAVFAGTAAFIFAMFLLSSTKIVHYLLPTYPYIAVAIALATGYLFTHYKESRKANAILSAGVVLLSVCALWVSIWYGFHIFSYISTNDVIVKEEKDVALIVKQDNLVLPLYAYQYDYYDTIEYYSGRTDITKMSDNQTLKDPFLLIASKEFMDWHSFPPELVAHLATLYKGQSVILYKFTP